MFTYDIFAYINTILLNIYVYYILFLLVDCPFKQMSGLLIDYVNEYFKAYVGPPSPSMLNERIVDSPSVAGIRTSCPICIFYYLYGLLIDYVNECFKAYVTPSDAIPLSTPMGVAVAGKYCTPLDELHIYIHEYIHVCLCIYNSTYSNEYIQPLFSIYFQREYC
jgi:hypothetical protein